jgi:hypothetical protein
MLLAAVATGCSTIETRKTERVSAYNSFSPQERALVDQGIIDVGMDTNAVYVAWGKPYEVLAVDFPSEDRTVWVYTGVATEEVPYWEYRPNPYVLGTGTYEYQVAYVGRRMVSGWVAFEKGRVASFESHAPSKTR